MLLLVAFSMRVHLKVTCFTANEQEAGRLSGIDKIDRAYHIYVALDRGLKIRTDPARGSQIGYIILVARSFHARGT